MSVIEGHAEHVMDAAAGPLDPGYARLRDRLEARRASRGGLGEVIARLLGMELKLRQYTARQGVLRRASSPRRHRGAEPGLARAPRRCRPSPSSSARSSGCAGRAAPAPA